MRSGELLIALSQTQGGIEVHIDHGHVRVTTRYASEPHVSAEADNLFDAAFECARQVREALDRYTSFQQFHPKLMQALEAYDNRTDILAL